jgi:hypothetical protein
MRKKKPKANLWFLFLGIVIFLLVFSRVYSYDRFCCGHHIQQELSVTDFITGIPGCIGWSYSDILYPLSKILGLVYSIYFIVLGLKGEQVMR